MGSGIGNCKHTEGQIAPSSSDGRGEQDRSDHRSNDHSKASPEKGENSNTERGNDAACLQAQSQAVADDIEAVATIQCSAKTQDNLKKVFDIAINVGIFAFTDRQSVLEYRFPVWL